MKRGIFAVLCVLLTGLLISGCAYYSGKGKPCVDLSAAEQAKAKEDMHQDAQIVLTAFAVAEEPEDCYDCPPRGVVTATAKTYVAPAPTRAETYTAPEPSYTTREEQGENWVFKWAPAEKGYFWAITNPKYLNASPDSSKGQGVYFVGEHQGWFSKGYPMQLVDGEYRVKVPVSKFLGRNRCNYLIMNDSPGDGIWAMFGPPDDKNWVQQGDYDAITNQDKYCIIFRVNEDGTVVPSE